MTFLRKPDDIRSVWLTSGGALEGAATARFQGFEGAKFSSSGHGKIMGKNVRINVDIERGASSTTKSAPVRTLLVSQLVS